MQTGEVRRDDGTETAAFTLPDRGVRRLSDDTRALAERYLSGEIGRAIRNAAFALPPEFITANPTPNRHYAEAVRRIATEAPLRILPGERLAGAATLREAMGHRVPLTPFASLSHTTLDFETPLRIGVRGIREQLDARRRAADLDTAGADLLDAMRICLDAIGVWHARHVDALERLAETTPDGEARGYRAVLASLRRVPESPPETFAEALQSLWLLWDFQRLCGNWSGVGRMDRLLGPFLRRDLDAGRITLDEARELLAHFWIKGCEWITAEGRGTGDAQFYQNVVLAGMDDDGAPLLNEMTDLVLDVVEELPISDFPIAVRLSATSPERLLRRVAAIQRYGGGTVAIYNDDRIVPMLERFGYPAAEARGYANDGCWELLIPGKTAFGYQPFDALLLLQETLGLSEPAPDVRSLKAECSDWKATPRAEGTAAAFPDFEALYADFRERLARTVDRLKDEGNPAHRRTAAGAPLPCPLLSLFVQDCIGRARSYLDGGPVYTVRSPHAGGLPDVANSLLVLRRLVYEERTLTLPELVSILQSDWEGHEGLRRRIASRFDFYGNDSEAADTLLRRVFDDYTEIVGRDRERHGVLRPAGISTFGREGAAFLSHRRATASGQRRGAVLAPNFSPSPGTDRRSPTAVIRSHCSVDLGRLPCGTALDLRLPPGSVRGAAGIEGMVGLLRAFVRLGGIFLQMDIVDPETLREAQAHPERHPNLAVRVSGWSARFATLDRQWQDMIIARAVSGGDRT